MSGIVSTHLRGPVPLFGGTLFLTWDSKVWVRVRVFRGEIIGSVAKVRNLMKFVSTPNILEYQRKLM